MKRDSEVAGIGGGEVDEEIDFEMKIGKSEETVAPSLIRRKCPYLDTVSRQKLDFDQQKICSITLTNMNVYACLVCGKFFQGRGKATPAYTHSVQQGHFVFMNLQDTAAYCLPDSYEIVDAALNDVKRCLAPVYRRDDILELSSNTSLARDVYGVSYLPGFVGLNNLKCTDYLNVILHALSHVRPLRNFFLLPSNYEYALKNPLVKTFGEVMRKLWSKDNFKSVISPQDFMHIVSVESKKRFNIGQQAEATDLLVWLLNELNRNLSTMAAKGVKEAGGSTKVAKKGLKTIIHDTFQGTVKVRTLVKPDPKSDMRGNDAAGRITEEDGEEWLETTTVSPFQLLSLDIPPTPLFRDSQGGLIIPQVPLFELLKKYDGKTWTDRAQASVGREGGLVRKQYSLKALPNYLVFHLARFTKNNFTEEKNPTIVTFPVKNLEMRDYLCVDEDAAEMAVEGAEAIPPAASIEGASVAELRSLIERWGSPRHKLELVTAVEKAHVTSLARGSLAFARDQQHPSAGAGTKYDLVANICHDTLTSQGLTAGLTTNTNTKGKSAAAVAAGSAAAAAGGSVATVAAAAAAAGATALNNGCYRIHVHNKATAQWFELQDLHVSETMPQLIGLSESYMLIYERQGLQDV